MQQLRDYPITNFSGGVVTDKGVYQMKDNEVWYALNGDFGDVGRVKKRYGSMQFGGFDVAPGVDEDFTGGTYIRNLNSFLMNNQNISGDGGMVYKLVASSCAGAVAAGATSIVLTDVTGFGADGTVEIDGDIITYTSIVSTTLTGVTGVTSAHDNGSAVHQWVRIYGSTQNTDEGVYYAYLNSLVIIARGGRGTDSYNGSSTSSVSTPTGLLYIQTYKQRIYGVDYTNQNKIQFSALTDGTSWTASDNFIVEDNIGEPIVGLRSYGGRLLIFKFNSSYYYNLSVLSDFNKQVGIYNNECHQELNGLVYLVGPRGAFVTNGVSTTEIGKPIKKWLDAYVPDRFDATTLDTFSAKTGFYRDLWLIYIGNVTVDQVAYTNVVLAYDTVHKNWTIWDGFTNLKGFISLQDYIDNAAINKPALFWGNNQQRFYRMFDNRSFVSNGSSSLTVGNIITKDKIYDTGVAIPFEMITKWYHQNAPGWWKRFGYLRVLAEAWPFDVEVRTLTDKGYSNWKPLGQVTGPNQVFKIDLEGYAIQIRAIEDSGNDPMVLNGFVLEQTMAISKNYK